MTIANRVSAAGFERLHFLRGLNSVDARVQGLVLTTPEQSPPATSS
jgi:hypothetical protein